MRSLPTPLKLRRASRSLLIFLSGIGIALAGTAIGQFAAESAPSATTATATMQAFPDVQKDTFFAPSVATMVRSGVVKGYSDGNFGPGDPVSRAQVTVMIDRYDQNVIQPLREQLDELRKKNNLGRCGDAIVQAGEQCDDGNTANGDGCSGTCLTEIVLPPPATCGNGKCEQGERALCPTCTSDSLCKPCTPCPEDCPATCGNGTCDPGEATVCTTKCPAGDQKGCANLCTVGTCPKDCSVSTPPVCGNGKCEQGEATVCPLCGVGMLCQGACIDGNCPQDCGQTGTIEQAPTPQPQQIGGQTDEHGCYISAGYSWCTIKQKCLRIWEEPCE